MTAGSIGCLVKFLAFIIVSSDVISEVESEFLRNSGTVVIVLEDGSAIVVVLLLFTCLAGCTVGISAVSRGTSSSISSSVGSGVLSLGLFLSNLECEQLIFLEEAFFQSPISLPLVFPDFKESKSFVTRSDVGCWLQFFIITWIVMDIMRSCLLELWEVEIPWSRCPIVSFDHFFLIPDILDQEDLGHFIAIIEVNWDLAEGFYQSCIRVLPSSWKEFVELFDLYESSVCELPKGVVVIWNLDLNSLLSNLLSWVLNNEHNLVLHLIKRGVVKFSVVVAHACIHILWGDCDVKSFIQCFRQIFCIKLFNIFPSFSSFCRKV